MFGIGQPELIIIIFILLLFFGPGRLPKLSKTLGESATALRDGFTGGKNDKSLRDITEEVTSSAKEIKKGVAEVKGTLVDGITGAETNDSVSGNPQPHEKDIQERSKYGASTYSR